MRLDVFCGQTEPELGCLGKNTLKQIVFSIDLDHNNKHLLLPIYANILKPLIYFFATVFGDFQLLLKRVFKYFSSLLTGAMHVRKLLTTRLYDEKYRLSNWQLIVTQWK